MGRVHRAQWEVEEERAIRCRVLLVLHVADRSVGEVFGEVVPGFGRGRRIDVLVVADEVRAPLVRVALEKPVVALEAEPERPPVERSRMRTLARRDEVPLPHRERVVPAITQQSRHRGRRLRDPSRVARIGRGHVGQEPHPDRVRVASGEQARPGGRTERGHVEAVVPEPVRGEPIDVRRLDPRAEASELREAGVVEHDEHHVRRPLLGVRQGEVAGGRLFGREAGPRPGRSAHVRTLLLGEGQVARPRNRPHYTRRTSFRLGGTRP